MALQGLLRAGALALAAAVTVAGCGSPAVHPAGTVTRSAQRPDVPPSTGGTASRPAPGATGPTVTVAGGQVEEPGPSQGRLVTTPGGVVLLDDVPGSAGAVAPVAGSPAWDWRPVAALPPAQARGRHVDVFYTPHPDDETLSMGVLIAADVARGDRVIVVALTDGRTTGALAAINARLTGATATPTTPRRPGTTGRTAPKGAVPAGPFAGAGRAFRSPTGGPALTRDQIAAARIGELRRATADLGVAPSDLFLAHLDADGTDGGSLVTVAEASAVMRAFAARFPGATHVTMSDVAERQQDHLDAGVALHHLLDAHVVTSALWTVSRLWWRLGSPDWSWAVPADDTARQRVRRAAQEYQTWNPVRGEYAVGFYSVRWQFAAVAADVRDRVHGTGPSRAGL